jgi:hypothetical protein
MKECDNSKIHISSDLLLTICLLIMSDTLLLGPSLHCIHLATFHHTSLHLSTLHFLLLGPYQTSKIPFVIVWKTTCRIFSTRCMYLLEIILLKNINRFVILTGGGDTVCLMWALRWIIVYFEVNFRLRRVEQPHKDYSNSQFVITNLMHICFIS